MGVFHWNQPCDSTTLGLVAKVGESARQDVVHPGLSGSGSGPDLGSG